MKRNDMIVMIVGLLFAVGLFVFIKTQQKDGVEVCIKLNGEVYATENLANNQIMEIADKGGSLINVLVIEDGEVYMSKATCPDALCIQQGRIQATHETIVCLPNRVTAEILGEDSGTIDAIAQ